MKVKQVISSVYGLGVQTWRLFDYMFNWLLLKNWNTVAELWQRCGATNKFSKSLFVSHGEIRFIDSKRYDGLASDELANFKKMTSTTEEKLEDACLSLGMLSGGFKVLFLLFTIVSLIFGVIMGDGFVNGVKAIAIMSTPLLFLYVLLTHKIFLSCMKAISKSMIDLEDSSSMIEFLVGVSNRQDADMFKSHLELAPTKRKTVAL